MGAEQTKSRAGPPVEKVRCKTVLGASGICDYSLNCYIGCAHACAYCYARFMGRFHHPGRPWGSFVDAKVNAPEVLARQLSRRGLFAAGSVFVSSVCDPYQPAEEKLGLTRKCLGMLLEAGLEVHLQTKSVLVQRDFDLLSGRDNVSVCETITTLDADLAERIEPLAPPPAERLAALRAARRLGIRAKAFVGPLLPTLSDTSDSLRAVFSALAPLGVEQVYVDRLNLRWGVWPALSRTLRAFAPEAVEPARAILFDASASRTYNRALRQRVRAAAAAAGLTARLRVFG